VSDELACLTSSSFSISNHAMASRRNRPWLTAISAALLLAGATCIPSAAQTPDPNRILIEEFLFTPNPLTINAGSTVTWVNRDDEPHTVVSNTRMFHSGALDTNESFSFKFDEPGTYHFTCSMHPRMVGIVIVQQAP
jgi:plastocyanin